MGMKSNRALQFGHQRWKTGRALDENRTVGLRKGSVNRWVTSSNWVDRRRAGPAGVRRRSRRRGPRPATAAPRAAASLGASAAPATPSPSAAVAAAAAAAQVAANAWRRRRPHWSPKNFLGAASSDRIRPMATASGRYFGLSLQSFKWCVETIELIFG